MSRLNQPCVLSDFRQRSLPGSCAVCWLTLPAVCCGVQLSPVSPMPPPLTGAVSPRCCPPPLTGTVCVWSGRRVTPELRLSACWTSRAVSPSAPTRGVQGRGASVWRFVGDSVDTIESSLTKGAGELLWRMLQQCCHHCCGWTEFGVVPRRSVAVVICDERLG